MSSFPRSLRSLDADTHGKSFAMIGVAAILIAGWAAWFGLSRVPVRASSVDGRVVLDRAVFPVHVAVSGEVRSLSGLALGRKVEKGELLVELDDIEERLRIDEENARLAGLQREREAVERRLEALRAAAGEALEAARAERDEASMRLAELELGAELASEEHSRLERLHEMGGVSELELSRARIEALKTRTTVEGYMISLERLGFDQRKLGNDRDAELEGLARDRDAIGGRIETSRMALVRLEHALSKRSVRAPATGELAEVATIGPGAWVEGGTRLAAIVSPSALKVVASFAPEIALGHVQRGQTARLRFDGFPWSRYGVVHARVEEVGREAREGKIQVELEFDESIPTEIPLQHGLLCAVEVDIDRVSPAELVLRAVGRKSPRPAETAPVER